MGWVGSLTHRQVMAWGIWIEESWHYLELTDYYLMQNTQMVHNVNSKKQKQLDTFQIKFKLPPPSQRKTQVAHKITKEVAAAWARAKWCSAVGMKPIKKEEITDVGTT